MPFVQDLLPHISNNVFVETGTYQGNTVNIILQNTKCTKICSLELSNVFYENCTQRFCDESRVKIFHANSKYDLYDVIKDIDTSITFWLDVDSDPEIKCPILFELDQIKKHSIKSHVIIVDNMRHMNEDDFKVTKKEIENKIVEINPKYKIIYFDDQEAKNDVLLAYVEPKICIHKYITSCRTNPQPPGFADFLRGTIALYQYSKKYGYDLYIDAVVHPIFQYFIKNEHYLEYSIDSHVNEFIPPLSYPMIDDILNQMFSKGNSGIVLTNSFYRKSRTDQEITNFHRGLDDNETKKFMRSILIPTTKIKTKIDDIFHTNYKMKEDCEYNVIHIRTGDRYIHNVTTIDYDMYRLYLEKIKGILDMDSNQEAKYILITDSKAMGKEWKLNAPRLLYWDNNKNHMGDLKNGGAQNVEDTVIDFCILQRAKKIYSNGSGFSNCISVIYDIPYEVI